MPSNSDRLILEEISRRLYEIGRTLNAIEQHLRPDASSTGVEIYSIINGLEERIDQMKEIAVDQSVPLKAVFKDKNQNPAKVDGAPKWSVSDTALAEITPSEDGMTATLKALGTVGVVDVTVTGDADMGAGLKEVSKTIQIGFVPLEATLVDIEVGDPIQ